MSQRVAIVTGSAQGIGLSVAKELAGRGYRVVISDLDEARTKAAAAEVEGAIAIVCDVTDEDQVKALVDGTVQQLGRLDVMVPNAGIATVKPITEMDLATWRKVTSVNLDGVFLSMRYAAPAIIASGGGSIVNIASVSGKVGSPLISSYAAAKAAVANLTQTAACELRDHGVRVNAVQPAFIGTELVTSNAANFEHYLNMPEGSFGEIIAAKQGRFGDTEDVARVVAFLADPKQSWMTGSLVTIDGGMTANLL
ncbi:MAG TPA: glucose 1-dehydrogenase [Marmoricola sp.]|nr:glucose 1-dehydrogenase [Marmoricola sp.]